MLNAVFHNSIHSTSSRTPFMSQNTAGQAILTALYEYLLITIPVGLYIALEATHQHHWPLLIRSPEWSMATIFLLFQGLSLYVRHLTGTGAKVSGVSIGILALLSLLITAFTLVNAYTSLDPAHNTMSAIVFRLGLFLITSVGFFLMVAGARLYHLRQELSTDG
jgi:hypothetical protein